MLTRSNPRAIFFPAHKTAFAAGGAGPGLPLHTQHALHTFSSLRRTLPCRPPNPDTISRLFSPPFPTFRRSLSLRPVGGRALIVLSSEVIVGGWLQLNARQEASGGGVEVEGGGIGDTFPSGLIVVRVHVCHCMG